MGYISTTALQHGNILFNLNLLWNFTISENYEINWSSVI